MTERENLPTVIDAQAVVVSTTQCGSLVGRGLAALQECKKSELIRNSQDECYRQARMVLDRRFGMIRMIGRWYMSDMSSAKDNFALVSAFKTFQQLADENYGKAYFPLSLFFGYFSSSAVSIARRAFEWCVANQANQDVELWCDLGEMYQEKLCGELDATQAMNWFRKAAEQGDARGQINLGYMYEVTADVNENENDFEQAVYWYRKAANQGVASAQYRLYALKASLEANKLAAAARAQYRHAVIREFEKDVPKNHEEVEKLKFYLLSAYFGDAEAQEALRKLGIDWKNNAP